MTLKTDSEYIEWSFSIGCFERYVNSKSDYLELLLGVVYFEIKNMNKSYGKVVINTPMYFGFNG